MGYLYFYMWENYNQSEFTEIEKTMPKENVFYVAYTAKRAALQTQFNQTAKLEGKALALNQLHQQIPSLLPLSVTDRAELVALGLVILTNSDETAANYLAGQIAQHIEKKPNAPLIIRQPQLTENDNWFAALATLASLSENHLALTSSHFADLNPAQWHYFLTLIRQISRLDLSAGEFTDLDHVRAHSFCRALKENTCSLNLSAASFDQDTLLELIKEAQRLETLD